jgi:hypothetical protein
MTARLEMMMVGRVISVSTRPPAMAPSVVRRRVDEHRQSEQTENDRRYCSQVVHVDLDQVGPAILWCEFLQVDRGTDTDRKRQQQGNHQREKRPGQRAADPGQFRLAGITGGEEGAVEFLFQALTGAQCVYPCQLALRQSHGCGIFLVGYVLDVHIDIVIGRQPDIDGISDDGRVGNHLVA